MKILHGQSCSPLPTFNRTFTNQTVSTASTFVGENIRITGTVNFNANINMVRCTVLMDPGAILNINNSTFSLLNDPGTAGAPRSVIFGCTTMWQAINVNSGGAVIFRNSDIRDGRRGVVFNPGFLNTITQITGCNFSRNTASIQATNVNNLTFATFSGNSFTGPSPFDPLLSPHVTGNPVNAFRFVGCTGSIGTSGTVNLIRRMSVGIRMTNNCALTFNNFQISSSAISDSENGGQGIGIHSIGSSLTIQNIFSNNSSCSFTSNRRAIRSVQTVSLVVKDATFQTSGISDIEVITSTNASNVQITNNTMNLGALGAQSILLNRSAQSAGINTRIQSNTVTLPAGVGTIPNPVRFINVTTQPGATDQLVIANNQISCFYGNPTTGSTVGIDGIFVSGNADGCQIAGNILNYQSSNQVPNANLTSWGITIQNNNGVNNLIGPNNNITSIRFPNQVTLRDSWMRCGIHVENSLNVAMCKNDITDSRHNCHLANNCANIEFGRNKLRSGIVGLELEGTVPNTHNYRMNEWVPGSIYNVSGARNQGQGNPSWLVDGSGGNPVGYLPPAFTPNNTSPTPLFIDIANGFASSTPICDAAVPPPGLGTPPTGEIVHNFLNNGYGGLGTAEAIWDFERVLLTQMIRFPATFAGNNEAEQYYNGKVNSAVWKFAQAERMLHHASAISNTDQQNLLQLFVEAQVIADSLTKIEKWEGDNESSINPVWQTSKSTLLNDLANKQAQIAALNASIVSARQNNLVVVHSFIQALPTSNVLESNQKTVLNLLCKQSALEDWTNADSVALRTVAYSCPATGGVAVTSAREMLPTPEAYAFGREGTDNLCDKEWQEGSTDRAPGQTLKPVSIWPNPAQDVFQVGFGTPFTGTLEVLDATTGALLQTVQVKAVLQQSLRTEGWHNGVYVLKVSTLEGATQSHKFVVLH